jgi:hypothetical protein
VESGQTLDPMLRHFPMATEASRESNKESVSSQERKL